MVINLIEHAGVRHPHGDDCAFLSDRPLHPVSRFVDHWRSLNDGNLPSRRQFKPKDTPQILPWLTIFDVVDANDVTPRTLRYRLMGERFRELYGRNVVGQLLDDVLTSPSLEERRQSLLNAVDRQEIQLGDREVPLDGREFLTVLYGVFPFACDKSGCQVFMVAAPETERVSPQLPN